MTSNPPPQPRKRRVAGRIAAWTAVATIGALAVTGIALAAPSVTASNDTASAPSPSASGQATPDPSTRGERPDRGKRHGHLPRLGRVVHGESVVRGRDGKFVTVHTQRGEVTAVSATSITLKSADGFTATYAVNAETKIGTDRGKDRQAAKVDDVKVGDQAGVLATTSGDSKTARWIRVGDPGKDD